MEPKEPSRGIFHTVCPSTCRHCLILSSPPVFANGAEFPFLLLHSFSSQLGCLTHLSTHRQFWGELFFEPLLRSCHFVTKTFSQDPSQLKLAKFVCLFCLLQPWLRIHCNRYCKRLYLLVDTEWCGQCSKLCPRHTACTWKTQVMDALRRSCIQLIRSLRMHPQDRLARPFRRRHLYHVLWLHLARRIRLPLPHRHRHKYLDPRCSG